MWSDFYWLNWLRGWGLYWMWAWHPQKFCGSLRPPSLQIPPSNNPRSATEMCWFRTTTSDSWTLAKFIHKKIQVNGIQGATAKSLIGHSIYRPIAHSIALSRSVDLQKTLLSPWPQLLVAYWWAQIRAPHKGTWKVVYKPLGYFVYRGLGLIPAALIEIPSCWGSANVKYLIKVP